MLILHKLYSFNVADSDLVNIYNLYIRSILVWHYAITQEEISDLERVQKVATKVILQDRYTNHDQALISLNLDPLHSRREQLCLKFAKKCLKHKNTKEMFPLNSNLDQNLRVNQKFQVQFASTSRLRDSAIPQLQRALHKDALK